MKVYCCNCKHYFWVECEAPQNTRIVDTPSCQEGIRILEHTKLNKNNDCPYYKKSSWLDNLHKTIRLMP
jgi:hypothetical protein